MSLSAPSWRSARRCLFHNPSTLPIRSRPQAPSQRFLSQSSRKLAENDNNDSKPKTSNPVLDTYLRDNPSSSTAQQDQQIDSRPGDLGATSIFEDERRTQEQMQREDTGAGASSLPSEDAAATAKKNPEDQRNPQNMQHVLDPDPRSRERYARKQVIKLVRKGGRLSKTEFVKRTEREHLVKSHNMKTSVKKLGHMARQIAGKTIEDAIVQMRFSKKKVAQELLKQLEFARDEAVVARGMGLGQVNLQGQGEAAPNLNADMPAQISGAQPPSQATETQPTPTRPLDIQLKDGKRHTVTDPTRIYIAQAWVGRGPYGKLPDYRARGRVYVMRTPWTSISVVLKEEATRVREWREREERRRKRKLGTGMWTHLPDRPVQQKQQYFSW